MDALFCAYVHKYPNRGAFIVLSTRKEVAQIICEYLKDELWFTLLCKKMQMQ